MLALRTSPAGFPMAPSADEWEALSPTERLAAVEEDRLRFYAGTALLLESDELIARLQAMAEDAERRAAEEAQLRDRLLPAHGEPVIGEARTKYRAAVARVTGKPADA